ncbi:hypothetical protein [Streptomyces sp. NPDC001933]|uniref:hypothetical protein n=1 Tax=Streptomyces sp. NPDC001933 TaxID=3364626 RepID=UPI0036B29D1A
MHMALQFAGRGFVEEGEGPSGPDGSRFEGRFVVYGIAAADGPVFGDDVSLLADDGSHGREVRLPSAAHFTAIRSGTTTEHLTTSDDTFEGLQIMKHSSSTRLRIYFDAEPDGTRDFRDRESFRRGQLIATYKADEITQVAPRAGVFDTRVNCRLLESTPFTFGGRIVDFADLAPSMVEISHGHAPEALASPISIPHHEAPFDNDGPGVFGRQFAVGGMMLVAS